VRIRDALDDLGDEGLVGLARYDGDCRCRAVNEVLADAVGVPVRAQVGRRPGELEGPWAAEAEALLRRVLATGKPVSHHAVIVRPSAGAGTVASSSWSTVWLPTRNADGTVNGVALLAIQVPGTDSALARLERAEARYRSLGDVGALDVVHLDADGRLDVDVPRWRQLTGQTPEQVADDGWLDAVHPDDRPRTAAEWERARATAQPSALEYRLRTAGGGERLVEGRLVPLVEDGRVVEWVGTTRDVTQERLNAAKRDRYARAAARSAARTERLQQATAALAGAVTTDDVAAAVLAQGRLAFGAAAGSVLQLEPDGESLRFAAVEGYGADLVHQNTPLRVSDDGLVATAIRDNVCLFVGSREELERTRSGALTGRLAASTGDRAWAVLPLATTGPPVGALALAFRVEREFSEEDQAFLVALAGQCAQALDRARLYDRVVAEAAEARAAGDRLEVLARATAEVNAALDVEAALTALADVVVPRLADVCAVYVVGGRTPPEHDAPFRLQLHAWRTTPDLPVFTPRQLLEVPDTSPVAAALATGRAVRSRLDEVLAGRVGQPELVRWAIAAGGHSALAVPLLVRGDPAGLVWMLAGAGRPPYGDEDAVFATELAARGAVALEHAQLFRRSQQVALTLQRSLLPSTDVVLDELTVASRYVAGAADTEVGGDWYDVIELGAGRVALVIGDVMGRGVRAAAVMGQLRSAVRAYARQDLPPAELLELLDGLVADLDEGQLVTCVYAVWDPGALRLTLAVAGHPPPLLRRPDGEVIALEVDEGTPLGLGAGGVHGDHRAAGARRAARDVHRRVAGEPVAGGGRGTGPVRGRAPHGRG